VKEENMSAADEIKRAIYARYPMVYIVSWEEKRVEDLLNTFSKSAFQEELYVWSSTEGLKKGNTPIEDAHSLLEALSYAAGAERGFFLCKDIHCYMNDPLVVRKLRDTYFYISQSQ